MTAPLTAPEFATQCALQPVDDGVIRCRILADRVVVGEIRYLNMHSHAIFLGSRRLLLRDDSTAALVARGASRWRVFLQLLWRARRWSLHEDEREIAQLRLRWRWAQQERIELEAAGECWSVVPRKGWTSRVDDLLRGAALVGTVRSASWLHDGVVLEGGGMPLAQAVGLLLAVQRSWYGNTRG